MSTPRHAHHQLLSSSSNTNSLFQSGPRRRHLKLHPDELPTRVRHPRSSTSTVLPAATGRYVNTPHADKCSPCQAGTSTNNNGTAVCSNCTMGEYVVHTSRARAPRPTPNMSPANSQSPSAPTRTSPASTARSASPPPPPPPPAHALLPSPCSPTALARAPPASRSTARPLASAATTSTSKPPPP